MNASVGIAAFAISCCLAFLVAGASSACASGDEALLVFYMSKGTRVTNAEGKVLEVGSEWRLGGDMNRVSEVEDALEEVLRWRVTVPASSSYTLTGQGEGVYFEIIPGGGDDDSGAMFRAPGRCGSVTVTRAGGDWAIEAKGVRGKAEARVWHRGGFAVYVSGTARGAVAMSSSAAGATLRGMSGLARVEADDYEGWDGGPSGRWWLPSAERDYRIFCTKESVRVPGAFGVKGLVRGHVTGLAARATGDGRAFLTWNKVKGARSYRVFRLDPKSGEWERAALRRGRAKNWCALSGTGRPYDVFRVRAYSDRAGKEPACRRSYWVSAAYGDGYSNATGLSGVPRSLSLKAGAARRLSASPVHGSAPLLSRKVRWYTSNPRVATVDRRGRVAAVASGRCKVWAKAHDGANSRRVVVTVR